MVCVHNFRVRGSWVVFGKSEIDVLPKIRSTACWLRLSHWNHARQISRSRFFMTPSKFEYEYRLAGAGLSTSTKSSPKATSRAGSGGGGETLSRSEAQRPVIDSGRRSLEPRAWKRGAGQSPHGATPRRGSCLPNASDSRSGRLVKTPTHSDERRREGFPHAAADRNSVSTDRRANELVY